MDGALKLSTQARLCEQLDTMEGDARRAGLFVTARALNNAKNAAGWEASGDVLAAGAAARGDRPTESRGQGR